MWEAMRSLWRYGLLLVHDVPKEYNQESAQAEHGEESTPIPYMSATEAFAKRVGFVRRTLYGDMW